MLNPFKYQNEIEAGCDEAGRGCIAGPVCAAAVILPKTFHHPLLNDSKKLNEPTRNLLKPIIEQEAIAYAIAFVYQQEIDAINILKSSIKAMHLALGQLKQQPSFILVDGNRFYPYQNIPHETIIKGDGKYASIAAASVLAKTYRDDYMNALHNNFAHYNWNTNKGYPTIQHRKAVKEFGLCIHHRKSFACLPKQIELSL